MDGSPSALREAPPAAPRHWCRFHTANFTYIVLSSSSFVDQLLSANAIGASVHQGRILFCLSVCLSFFLSCPLCWAFRHYSFLNYQAKWFQQSKYQAWVFLLCFDIRSFQLRHPLMVQLSVTKMHLNCLTNRDSILIVIHWCFVRVLELDNLNVIITELILALI